MQDLGQKVVALNLRLNKLDRKLDLVPLTFQQQFQSNYGNLLVIKVEQLNKRVVRLERLLGIATNKKIPSNSLLKNIAMKINALCQRIIILERMI